MHKKHCGCNSNINCGCQQPNFIGCETKVDLLCTEYTGVPLSTLEIEKGENANVIFKAINDYLANIEDPEDQQVLIESVGDAIPVYKGLNTSSFIHEFKSIRGIEGIIVRDREASECESGSNEIEVLIDKSWLTNFLNEWILTVDLCPLVAECSPQPEHNPVTSNIVKSVPNRTLYNFTSNDFTSHFSDSQLHSISSITITGDTTGFSRSSSPLVSGDTVPFSSIASGDLSYTGLDQDEGYTKTVSYVATDSIGAISNTSSIIISVATKIFLVFSTPTVSLIRSVSNSKTATVNYTNGTGQVIPNGTVLVNQGTVGQPGYLRITTVGNVTANGSGTMNISVSSIPTSSQANQTISYVIDGSTGNINLTYNSNPVTQDLVIDIDNRDTRTFTTAEFISKYTDFDGNAMTEIKAEAPVTNYLFNNVPYVAGTWIPVNNIDELSYTGSNIDTAYQQITPWFAKDSQGNISQ